MLVVAGATVLADRFSKIWAIAELSDGTRIPIFGRYLGLSLVMNPGAAFGLFPGATIVLFFASLIIVTGALIWGFSEPRYRLPMGLVIGGGIGNLVDRLINPPGPMRGEVIDFIDSSFWPTFNLADSAIVVGVAILLLMQAKQKEEPSEPGAEGGR